MANSKKPTLWAAYAICLSHSMTVRRTAANVGLSVSTAFRWRHALLGPLQSGDTTIIEGWIELMDVWFAFSEKGSRDLRREPRRRGVANRPRFRSMTYAGAGVRAILAADRVGRVVSDVVHADRVTTSDLVRVLGGRIGKPALVASLEPRLGPWGTFARIIGATFHQCRGRVRVDRLASVATVVACASRMRAWLLRFRGVATKYLANYLGWHRLIDAPLRFAPPEVVMRWPIRASSGPARN